MAYKDKIVKIKGDKKGDIFLFTLSTCGWCAMTKQFFREQKLEYSYVDVDLLSNNDQAEVDKELKRYKTDSSFPKIIINNAIISGFDERVVRKELNKWKK